MTRLKKFYIIKPDGDAPLREIFKTLEEAVVEAGAVSVRRRGAPVHIMVSLIWVTAAPNTPERHTYDE